MNVVYFYTSGIVGPCSRFMPLNLFPHQSQTSINVTYHNPDRRDLLAEPPKRYEVGLRDGSKIEVKGPTIPSDLADKTRRVVFVDSIDAYF